MAMATQCPSCETVFRVTPQQLQAHRGQVRCGRCLTVFDGLRGLTTLPVTAVESGAAPPARGPTEAAESSSVAEERAGAAYAPAPDRAGAGAVPTHETAATSFTADAEHQPPRLAAAPEGEAASIRAREGVESSETDATHFALGGEGDTAPAASEPGAGVPRSEADRSWKADHAPSVDTGAAEGEPSSERVLEEAVLPARDELDFSVHPYEEYKTRARDDGLEYAPSAITGGSSADSVLAIDADEGDHYIEPQQERAWPWWVGSAVLVLVLLAQAAYYYRSDLAARNPALKPILNKMCTLAGCRVPLPQRPRLISIEASDMQAIDPGRPGVIRLTATLRNHATYDVGYPALDLVLTTSREHTLARRVFLPREYLDLTRNPEAGIPAKAEITVGIDMDTGDLGAAGFRLDLLPAPAP